MQSPWVRLELAAARHLRIPVVTIKNCHTRTIKKTRSLEAYSHSAEHSIWCQQYTIYKPSYNVEAPTVPLSSM
jgi:hypothetical protein